jgi:hypothetical protein
VLLHSAVRPVGPTQIEGLQSLDGRPGIIGNDRDGIVLVDDLPHAWHGHGRLTAQRLDGGSTRHGGLRDHRHAQSLQPHVDAE